MRSPADVLLPTDLAAEQLGIGPATLRDWARRGLIAPAGGTARRPLWRGSDLLAAARLPKPRRRAA